MKGVRCSWVDMMKIRQALADSERGAQAAMEKMRCVDKATISRWKAASDLVAVVEDKVAISQLENFQPSHATILTSHFRRVAGREWSEETKEQIAEWVDRCETEEWTVLELKEQLRRHTASFCPSGNGAPSANGKPPGCTADDLHRLAATGATFGAIYADPPWQYGNQATRASTDNHYVTMTVDELALLPVGKLAAPQSHLWLWTTNGFLFECPKLFAAWGFEFKSSYIWVKPQFGIGNYLRNAHEFLLLAVRGGLTALARDVRSWGEFDRGEHSAKPEAIRSTVVECISPGPYLELFGRSAVEGWTVWGNEVSRDLFTADMDRL